MLSSQTGNDVAVKILAGLAVFFLILTILTGCDARSATSQAMPPPQVDVADVLVETVTVTETFNGRLEAPQTARLRPRVTGYINEVAFTEGELVKEGDLLFQIDPRPYEARVRAAEAELVQAEIALELARSESNRAARLLEGRAISAEENEQRLSALTNAQARVNAAEAALDTAELDLEYTRITAPVAGRAGRAMITEGNLANADQTLLTTVVSVDPLYVYFDSNEASALSSQTLVKTDGSTELRIELSDDNTRPYGGVLDYIDNAVNADTGTLQFRAVLNNPEGALRPGQFARVEMPVQKIDEALLVRRQAVLTDQDRRFVYLVANDNTVSRRQVVTGQQIGDLVVIHDGLQGGERVVVNGTQKIFAAGMEVSPQQVAMSLSPNADNNTIASTGR